VRGGSELPLTLVERGNSIGAFRSPPPPAGGYGEPKQKLFQYIFLIFFCPDFFLLIRIEKFSVLVFS